MKQSFSVLTLKPFILIQLHDSSPVLYKVNKRNNCEILPIALSYILVFVAVAVVFASRGMVAGPRGIKSSPPSLANNFSSFRTFAHPQTLASRLRVETL